MDLFDEGAHQGFPIQADLVFAFDLGEDFGDVEGLAGLSQYVNNPIHKSGTLHSIRGSLFGSNFCHFFLDCRLP
jgi:hypothetical protein